MANITTITNPTYDEMIDLWGAYRLTGEGGEEFLEEYLIQRPGEKADDFTRRKDITYTPSFSKAAVNQIINSVSQRLFSVRRIGGTQKYQRAMRGLDLGVDRAGRSMNSFSTTEIISELCIMGGVGVLVDAPNQAPTTLQDEENVSPYIYTYRVEDIRAWATDPLDPSRFTRLLLRDFVQELDQDFDLSVGFLERYRLYTLEDDGTITLTLFDADGEEVDVVNIDIPEIPFVFMKLSSSFMTDIYRHQIALLNLGSADMKYAWEGNTIFLVEQYDPNNPSEAYRRTSEDEDASDSGSAASVVSPDTTSKQFGVAKGARVPKNLEYPQYVSPDAEPLRVSIEKQAQVKDQIAELLNQSLRTVTSRSSSADSKKVDERKEEDGLRAVGSELEYGENRIAVFWSAFESQENTAQVKYPQSYQYLSSEERRKGVKDLSELMTLTPSLLAQKQIAKEIVMLLVGQNSTEEDLARMFKQIDDAKGVIADPEAIAKLVEMDLLDTETAVQQIGFPKEVAQKARKERLERAKDIAQAQSINNGARGNDALSVNPEQEAKQEKIDAGQE